MDISKNGIDLITHYEGGIKTQAYPDPATKNDLIKKGEPWTIGVGHTGVVDGKKVCKGMVITPQKAQELLKNDLQRFVVGVNSLVKVPITQAQFDALVSFAFNVGLDIDDDKIAEGLGDSSLLRYVNQKQFTLASAEFIKWDKANGKVMNGLVARRKSEALLFSTGKLQYFN